MTASNDNSPPGESNLYDHMPVYHSRLSSVQALLDQDTPLDLNTFHMHYDGTGPLQRALTFFGESGVLLDLGCGYGANVIWFAGQTPAYQSYLGVDLMGEHIDIARRLASRFIPQDGRAHYLACDITELTPAIYATHAETQQANRGARAQYVPASDGRATYGLLAVHRRDPATRGEKSISRTSSRKSASLRKCTTRWRKSPGVRICPIKPSMQV